MEPEAPRAEAFSQKEEDSSVRKEMRKLEQAKTTIEAEIKRLQNEIDLKEAYIKIYYLLKSDFFHAVYNRRVRARKVVAASLAISISSLTAGIRCSTNAAFNETIPWAIGIGVTSLAFTLIFSKDVWSSFKEHSRCKILENRDMNKRIEPESCFEDIKCMKILFQASMPDLLKICSTGKEIGAQAYAMSPDSLKVW